MFSIGESTEIVPKLIDSKEVHSLNIPFKDLTLDVIKLLKSIDFNFVHPLNKYSKDEAEGNCQLLKFIDSNEIHPLNI